MPALPFPSARTPQPLPCRGRQRAATIDPVALRQAYEAGASTVDLSRAHGVSRTTLRKLLKAAGAATRSVTEARKVRDANVYLSVPRPEAVAGRPEVVDVFGVAHRVTACKPTSYDWDLLIGFPSRTPGRSAVIVTAALADHLTAGRWQPGRHGLPLGDATVVRLRRRLRFDWRAENRAWWQAHRDELAATNVQSFAAHHGVNAAAAYHARHTLCGPKRGRLPGSEPVASAPSAMPD